MLVYYGILITQYSFGIITSKVGFDKHISKEKSDDEISNEKIGKVYCENLEKLYKFYTIMKKHCKDNNYELIIFVKENSKFYIHEEN